MTVTVGLPSGRLADIRMDRAPSAAFAARAHHPRRLQSDLLRITTAPPDKGTSFVSEEPNQEPRDLVLTCLRQYFPKGSDLSRWSAEELQAVATTLNNRPRETLGWKTPAGALNEQLLSLKQADVATAN